MKKQLIKIILIISFVLIQGCAQELPVQNKESPVLYSVADSTGTVLNFTQKPQRIISLGSGADEILFEAVEHNRIAALTYLADDPGISVIADEAKAVKGRVQATNLEGVLAFKPDLVVMPDWSSSDFVAQLRSAGVNVFVYKTPTKIAEIEESIFKITAATGDTERGRRIVRQMENTLAEIGEKVNNIPPDKRRKVVVLSFMGPFGAEGTTFDDICRYANVENCIAQLKIPQNALYSKEILLQMNPDLLVLPSWDYGAEKQNPSQFKQEVLNDPAYSGITAAKSGEVYQLHEKYMYSISHNVVKAVDELARTAYPQLFNTKKEG